MFEASLEAEPSTPRPIGAPAASSSTVGQMPEARRMFELGQWQIPVPASPRRRISSALKWMPWASQVRGPSQPTLSR